MTERHHCGYCNVTYDGPECPRCNAAEVHYTVKMRTLDPGVGHFIRDPRFMATTAEQIEEKLRQTWPLTQWEVKPA